MRRADRLFQIVQYLRGGRLLTAAQLAGRLEVSERTIYRDIADLFGSGVPIDGEAGVGYLMRSGYDLPPLMFTQNEIIALVAGARMVRAWGGAAMAKGAEEALVKIDAVLPDDARTRARSVHIHAITMPRMNDDLRAIIDRLEQAVDKRRALQISYSDGAGSNTTRRIQPLGLYFWGNVWTLVAWCELRNDFRMFRLDRIKSIEDSGKFRPERQKSLPAFFAQEQRRQPRY
jgi:predicted DNA-binding transcriptional regulator YafY